MKSPDELREELLRLAPVDYEAWFKNADRRDIQNAVDILNGIVQSAARLAAYLESRDFDQGHKTAVRQSNSTVSKVRKALGYTYYKQDLHF